MVDIKPYIDVEALDTNLFRGINLWKPAAGRSVFGGQVVAQALHSAIKTIDVRTHAPHSLHSYFILPGKPEQPIYYSVTNIRDGKSYIVRRVDAMQSGNVIFIAMVSFQKLDITAAEGVAHAMSPPPDIPDPTHIPDTTTRIKAVLADDRLPDIFRERVMKQLAEVNPIDIRFCRRSDPLDPQPEVPRQLAWFKCKTPLSSTADADEDASMPYPKSHVDRMLHLVAVAYASDFALLGTALLPHRSPNPGVSFMASLDHSIWFHSPCRADDWLLYELESPRLVHGRGLAFGRIFRKDGTLVISTAQEGVIRFHPDYTTEMPVVIKRSTGAGGIVHAVETESVNPLLSYSRTSADGIVTQPSPTWGSVAPSAMKAKL